jgi:hypothetical protein
MFEQREHVEAGGLLDAWVKTGAVVQSILALRVLSARSPREAV